MVFFNSSLYHETAKDWFTWTALLSVNCYSFLVPFFLLYHLPVLHIAAWAFGVFHNGCVHSWGLSDLGALIFQIYYLTRRLIASGLCLRTGEEDPWKLNQAAVYTFSFKSSQQSWVSITVVSNFKRKWFVALLKWVILNVSITSFHVGQLFLQSDWMRSWTLYTVNTYSLIRIIKIMILYSCSWPRSHSQRSVNL